MTWTKKPHVSHKIGCVNCGTHDRLPLDYEIAEGGCGMASVTRDREQGFST